MAKWGMPWMKLDVPSIGSTTQRGLAGLPSIVPASSRRRPQSGRAWRNSSTTVCSARSSAMLTKSAGPLRLTWSCSTSPKSRRSRGAALRAARVMTVMRPEWLTKSRLQFPGRRRGGSGVGLSEGKAQAHPLTPLPRAGETQSFRPADVGLLVDVDDDPGSGGNVRRHHDAHAIVEDRRLVARGGGLPLHHGVGLDDHCLDRVRQLHRDRPLVVELHHHVHAVLEEGGGVADQLRGQRDLLVILLVHEHEHVAVMEQELEVLGVEADALHRLGRAETDIVLAAVDEVLHLDLHVGAALAGLGVLDLHRAPDAAFIFDDVAGTNVHAADLHGNARRIWRSAARL